MARRAYPDYGDVSRPFQVQGLLGLVSLPRLLLGGSVGTLDDSACQIGCIFLKSGVWETLGARVCCTISPAVIAQPFSKTWKAQVTVRLSRVSFHRAGLCGIL